MAPRTILEGLPLVQWGPQLGTARGYSGAMRENSLKALFTQGGAAVNGWLAIPSPISAEAMAHAGFDSLTIDLQHGAVGFEAAVTMLQAISTTDVVPMCRVPWNEPSVIMRLLDAGSYGVICPMINNREEAEALVGACRYPPAGHRSFGPNRVRFYAGADYGLEANEVVLVFAMIETRAGLENLESILDTPGLDGVYVGPSDLSLALGGPPGGDWEEGPAAEAIEVIVEATRQRGLVPGIHNASPGYALRMIEKGFQLVTVQNDLAYLGEQARRVTAAVRGGSQGCGGGSSDPY